MDKSNNKSSVLNIGMRFTMYGSLLFMVLGFLLSRMSNVSYIGFIVFIVIMQALQSLLSQYVKATGRVTLFAFNGMLLTFVTAGMDVIFLVFLKLGLLGYFWALIGGLFVSDMYLFWRGQILASLTLKKVNKDLEQQMVRFSLPLIPNSIVWWATNAVGRYFVVYFLGATANGIFAVGNKIPSMLSVVNSIFFQSWQISAIEEFKSPDRQEFFSNVFRIYSELMFLGTSLLIFILKPLMHIIVSDTFFVAWKYIPFLLLSVIYSSFSSFLGQYYVAAKKTSGVFTTTIYGTLLNVLLNFILIPKFHLFGASVASMLSYLVVWIVRAHDVEKLIQTKYDWRNLIINHFIILLQIVVLFYMQGIFMAIFETILVLIIFAENIEIVQVLIGSIRRN
ncbi:lipopolysaccharide biosynthesis protein [Levilactobacillus brevis]|nr:polysaccharide biosynthesis C-terminal domain-containing protein [Levilactobacillus brevis]